MANSKGVDDSKYDWTAFGKLGGRPSKYTDELAKEICMYISGGIPLQAICRREDMPAISTVLQWVVEDRKEIYTELSTEGEKLSTESVGFSELYTKAREAQGYYDADNIRDVVERALDGEIDASVARVAIDGMKWTAERNAGRSFGSKQTIDQKVDQTVSGSVSHSHTIKGDDIAEYLKSKHGKKEE